MPTDIHEILQRRAQEIADALNTAIPQVIAIHLAGIARLHQKCGGSDNLDPVYSFKLEHEIAAATQAHFQGILVASGVAEEFGITSSGKQVLEVVFRDSPLPEVKDAGDSPA